MRVRTLGDRFRNDRCDRLGSELSRSRWCGRVIVEGRQSTPKPTLQTAYYELDFDH